MDAKVAIRITLKIVTGPLRLLRRSFSALFTGIRRGISTVSNSLGIVTRALSLVGSAIRGGGSAFRFLTGANSQYEDSLVRLTTLFRGNEDAAKALLDRLSEFSQATPQQLNDIINAFAVIKTATPDNFPVIDFLETVVDLASATKRPLNEVSQLLARFIAGAQAGVAGEELNQLLTIGAITGPQKAELKELVDLFVLAQKGRRTGVVSSTDIENIEKLGYTLDDLRQIGLADITNKLGEFLGVFEGGAARDAETFSGALSTIRDQITALRREAGEAVFVEIKADVLGIREALDEALADAGESGISNLGDLIRESYRQLVPQDGPANLIREALSALQNEDLGGFIGEKVGSGFTKGWALARPALAEGITSIALDVIPGIISGIISELRTQAPGLRFILGDGASPAGGGSTPGVAGAVAAAAATAAIKATFARPGVTGAAKPDPRAKALLDRQTEALATATKNAENLNNALADAVNNIGTGGGIFV